MWTRQPRLLAMPIVSTSMRTDTEHAGGLSRATKLGGWKRRGGFNQAIERGASKPNLVDSAKARIAGLCRRVVFREGAA